MYFRNENSKPCFLLFTFTSFSVLSSAEPYPFGQIRRNTSFSDCEHCSRSDFGEEDGEDEEEDDVLDKVEGMVAGEEGGLLAARLLPGEWCPPPLQPRFI